MVKKILIGNMNKRLVRRSRFARRGKVNKQRLRISGIGANHCFQDIDRPFVTRRLSRRFVPQASFML